MALAVLPTLLRFNRVKSTRILKISMLWRVFRPGSIKLVTVSRLRTVAELVSSLDLDRKGTFGRKEVGRGISWALGWEKPK